MRNFILGTDWWTDCDDAVALRLLARFVKEKKINLLGIGINACMEYSVASLKGFLFANGLDRIPIGIDSDATDLGGSPPYQKHLADTFCPNGCNGDATDAVELYRTVLASCSEPIEIIEIGYLQVLANLLKSPPDAISNKSGLELVREKVSKFWIMGGKWDANGERENNFCRTEQTRKASAFFCKACPVPVTFLGWEVGYGVITGNLLDKSDPLYRVLSDHGSKNGRHSWDPMLVLMALIGNEESAGYRTIIGHASVDPDTGANYFVPDPAGIHKYVIKNYQNAKYERQINSLL